MTKRKELPIITPSVHTFSISGRINNEMLKLHIDKSLRSAADTDRYKWVGWNHIVRRGGGLHVQLHPNPKSMPCITLSNINLPRIGGDTSYLALTDLSVKGLLQHQEVFEQELKFLGIPWKSGDISWRLGRLDLTQDFYVKCDPSLTIRNLRFAGETGLYRGIHADHYTLHNEKHSSRWKSHWYDITVYNKHAEIKNRDEEYHNVPESDLIISKNRLRYELSLKRDFLREFERKVHVGSWGRNLGIDVGIQLYFSEISRYIPTILRKVSSELFGEYPWQRIAVVHHDLDFLMDACLVDSKAGQITKEYLRCLESAEPFPLTSKNEAIIRAVLDQLEVNRIVIPDCILTKRELRRFPCYPPGHFVQGNDESIDFMKFPVRPWRLKQKLHPTQL